jgi:hypothetical protein
MMTNTMKFSVQLLVAGMLLMTAASQQVSQSIPVPMMMMQQPVRLGYMPAATGLQTPYGAVAGQTIQKQQTIHQVTQTRPAGVGYMNPVMSSGSVVQPGVQHVQTTRVNQIRTVPVQNTGMSG